MPNNSPTPIGSGQDVTLVVNAIQDLVRSTNALQQAVAAGLPSSILGIANGGTGASTAPAAATNLGVGIGNSPQFLAVNVGDATDTTVSRASAGDLNVEGNLVYRAGGTDVPIADGGTGASTAAAAATNLGLGTASNPQFATIELGAATDTTLARASAGDVNVEGNLMYRAGGTDVPVTDGGTGSSTAAAAATALGLGTGNSPQFLAVNVGDATDTTVARASAGDISVEGNRIFRVGGVDVPIADGGTGSSTAAAAAINLLGDFDNGTFTPTLVSSGGGAATVAAAGGSYNKVNNGVRYQARIALTNLGTLAAGNLTIASMPFTSANVATNFAAQAFSGVAMGATATTALEAEIQANTTSISLFKFAAGTQSTLTQGDIGTAPRFNMGGTYTTV